MSQKYHRVNTGQTTIAGIILLMLVISGAFANHAKAASQVEAGRIELVSGKSIVLRTETAVKRISIANPEIADFNLLSPTEIYLTGKAAGTTNLTMWQDGRVAAVYDLIVSYDVSRLKQQMQEILPAEKDLRVVAANDSLTLSGKVTSAAALSQAISLTRAYAPEGKVTNLVEVGGVHQVMLEVRVAEMSRSLTRRLGINFAIAKGDQSFFVNTLGSLSQVVSLDDATIPGGPRIPFGHTFSSAVNSLFRFNTNNTTWTGFVDALQEDGLIKVLAEPNLVTLSGQTATFLAGGEFPIPVPQDNNTITIDYKQFGVGLNFTPVVLSKDKISMRVAPEVSELDYSTAVRVVGYVVPGLRVRRTATTIELGDGQSFAIAGLLRENMRTVVSKYPLLGDIPVLGALFQSKAFQKEETELIIIVTPHLVKPLDMAKQTLPTDFYVEPNDVEFYLMGKTEGAGSPKVKKGAMDGDFGHTMPKN
jgi:pilus assembly protein CpaC